MLLLALILAASPGGPTRPWKDVLLPDVPHVVQRPDFCGEACVEMALKRLGVTGDQNDVFAQTGLDPLLGRGAYTKDLATALGRIGFEVGDVWHQVEAGSDSDLEAEWSALHADLVAGVPSIVCMHFNFSPTTTEHFRLVLGYDSKRDEVVFHDPASRSGAYQHLRRADFLALWPLKYDSRRWTVIRLRLQPKGPLTLPRERAAAELAQHVMALKERLGDEASSFTLVSVPPFVVLGNQSPERVRASAEQIVAWSRTQLRALYFAKDPDRILDVWLLKDAASYRRWAIEVSGEPPGTPYGYYTSTYGALVMNIATGGGTLVHELVHPYMEANFVDPPAWLNEGLGSLYEQSDQRDGKIVGLTNWRLAGLQDAIRQGAVPSFKTLTHTTTQEFYSQDPGTNYAQARYLLFYLQEQGLLQQYWATLRANASSDPSGYGSLVKTLKEKDLAAFQKRWEQWVLSLRFP